jgi:hypothetical protein
MKHGEEIVVNLRLGGLALWTIRLGGVFETRNALACPDSHPESTLVAHTKYCIPTGDGKNSR